MNAAVSLRQARFRAELSLRQLAALSGTSHSALAAYEAGSKTPGVATLDRILRAAGFESDVSLQPRCRQSPMNDKGSELASVLELASAFPARHGDSLNYPVFGQTRIQSPGT